MNRFRGRKGVALLELLVVLGTMIVIIMTTSILLTIIYDLSIRRGELEKDRIAQERLLTVFRKDVKVFGAPEIIETAEKVELPSVGTIAGQIGPKIFLRWKTPDGELVYQCSAPDRSFIQVDRLLAKEGRIMTRESYSLSDKVRIEVYRGSGEDSDLIALSLWCCPLPSISVKKNELNPFTGTVSDALLKRVDPRLATNWKTAVQRIDQKR